MENSTTLALPAAPKATSQQLKSIFSGSVGNLVEWYDWYVYAAFSLYFAKAFFPQGDLTAQLLNTAAVFAIGFLMRPIGGWLMGVYADRKGRKAALLLSVLLMCFGSLIIALTPGYATLGVAAPALLVVARLLQGLSVGGEYGTSATYLSEMAGKERRGFFASFQYVTLISGQLLALGVLILLQSVTSLWGAFALIMFALVIVSGYTSVNAVVKAELFPAEIRAIGVGLPYALTQSVAGGTVEYVALWFKSIGNETGFFWYITAGIACSLLVYVCMRDTRDHSLIDRD